MLSQGHTLRLQQHHFKDICSLFSELCSLMQIFLDKTLSRPKLKKGKLRQHIFKMEISESIFNQISDSDRSRTDFTSETQLRKVYPPLHCHFL